MKEKQLSQNVVWNEHCLNDLVEASTFFCEYYMLRKLYGAIHGEKLSASSPKLTERSSKLQDLMGLMLRNFAVYWFIQKT